MSTKVLLVDDSSLVVDALRLLLEGHGYTVTVADSLATARSAVAQHVPDVIVLDVGLPDGDGLEFVRDWPADTAPAFLALTGHADQETRNRCLEVGCRDVLVKPVSSAELIRHIHAVTHG
jgi:two-component system, OmpR family, KDP operon response regulator KdpE